MSSKYDERLQSILRLCSWCRVGKKRRDSRFCSDNCEKEEKKQLLLEFSPAMAEHERKRKRGFGITEDNNERPESEVTTRDTERKDT